MQEKFEIWPEKAIARPIFGLDRRKTAIPHANQQWKYN